MTTGIARFNDFAMFDAPASQRHSGRRQRAAYRRRLEPFSAYSDTEFRQRYRFSKAGVRHILSHIEDQLRPSSRRNRPVSAILQLLITFRFFATGSFQKTDADLFGVHESTVNRIVHKVAKAIATLSTSKIVFPTTAEQQRMKTSFYENGNFPGVIGL